MRTPGWLLLSLLPLGACNRPYFVWSPREPLASRHGRVALAVDDRRPGDHGIVGRGFGIGGIPEDVRVADAEPHDRLQRLLVEATLTAGIGIADVAEPPTARVSLALDALACDGATLAARADIRVTLAIAGADGTPRLAPETFALVGKGRGCRLAYYEAFDRLLDELAARLVEGPVHDAVLDARGAEPTTRATPGDRPTAVAAAAPH